MVLDPVDAGGHGEQVADRAGGVSAAGKFGHVVHDPVLELQGVVVDGDPDEVGQRRLRHRGAEERVVRTEAVGVPLVDDLAVEQHQERGAMGAGVPLVEGEHPARPGDVHVQVTQLAGQPTRQPPRQLSRTTRRDRAE